MRVEILYGKSGLEIELGDDLEVTVIRKPAMPVLANAVGAVEAALARPVGAPRRQRTRLARRTSRMEFNSVVLPTPGPPVMTSARLDKASRNASRWLAARTLPVFVSHQASALSASMVGNADGATES